MGYPTRVQLIKRKKSHQWYVNFPAALAEAMEFEKSELVEWVVESKRKLSLKRSPQKKTINSKGSFKMKTSRKEDCHGISLR